MREGKDRVSFFVIISPGYKRLPSLMIASVLTRFQFWLVIASDNMKTALSRSKKPG